MDESACTTSRGGHIVTAETLAQMLSDLPEPPNIFAMEYRMFEIIPSKMLPNNTVIVSMDFAKKMGWVEQAKEGDNGDKIHKTD